MQTAVNISSWSMRWRCDSCVVYFKYWINTRRDGILCNVWILYSATAEMFALEWFSALKQLQKYDSHELCARLTGDFVSQEKNGLEWVVFVAETRYAHRILSSIACLGTTSNINRDVGHAQTLTKYSMHSRDVFGSLFRVHILECCSAVPAWVLYQHQHAIV